MHDISIRAIKGLGLTNTTFNIEYFYNPESGDLKIIEVNPRFSGQFGDIYEKVFYNFLFFLYHFSCYRNKYNYN